MKRRPFTILSALSLLLFVAVCVLWVRGRPGDGWGRRRYFADEKVYRQEEVCSRDGVMSLSSRRVSVDPACASMIERARPASARYRERWEYARVPAGIPIPPTVTRAPPPRRRLGFHLATVRGQRSRIFPPGTETVVSVGVPHWALAAATAALPLAWLRAARLRRPRRQGRLCPRCHYDLRATPGRCPECGLVPAAPPPTPSRENVDD